MSWRHYHLALRLKCPLHIGYRKVGNLMQTRRYVPARTIWGALVFTFTQKFGGPFKEWEKFLNDNFRFGYFWPSAEKERVTLFPWDDPQTFDYFYLDAYVSTATQSLVPSAEEGSLHHVEFISPFTLGSAKVKERDVSNGEQVFLVGDLWAKENNGRIKMPRNTQKGIDDLLKDLSFTLGGERTYGWGRIIVEECKLKEDELLISPDWNWRENNQKIIVQPRKDNLRVLAHVEAVSIEEKIAGYPEPLTAYRFKGNFDFEFEGVCFPPGSLLTDSNISFEITEAGIWKSAGP